ncbi:hypothetical protein [Roseivivax sp. CAU 1753]
MEIAQKDFLKRQKSIKKKHRRLADGYVTRVNKVGVIEHRPRRSVGRTTLMPIVLLGVLFLGFKVMLLTYLGEEQYLSHVDALTSGGLVEQIGARVMQIDPATARMTELVAGVL